LRDKMVDFGASIDDRGKMRWPDNERFGFR
jgi:hypothetical protein